MTLSIKNGGYVVLIRLDLMFSNWSSFHNDIKLVRIRLVFNSFKIKDYFSYKDPVPNDLESFLAYKFTCASRSSGYICFYFVLFFLFLLFCLVFCVSLSSIIFIISDTNYQHPLLS